MKTYTRQELLERLDKIEMGDIVYNEIKQFIEDLD